MPAITDPKELAALIEETGQLMLRSGAYNSFRKLAASETEMILAALRASGDVSRDSVLEEAAKVCEAKFQDHYDHSQRKGGAIECADAIRALKGRDNSALLPKND